jgi:hypothetical protein
MAAAVAPDGLVIGYDGSEMLGREEVQKHLAAIFRDHQQGRTSPRSARYAPSLRRWTSYMLSSAWFHQGNHRSWARNAIQTVVACRDHQGWSAALFQTAPAQFHGRPELAEALTAEPDDVIASST